MVQACASSSRLRALPHTIVLALHSLLRNQGHLVEWTSLKPTAPEIFRGGTVTEQAYKVFVPLQLKVWNSAETYG